MSQAEKIKVCFCICTIVPNIRLPWIFVVVAPFFYCVCVLTHSVGSQAFSCVEVSSRGAEQMSTMSF